MTNTWGLSHDQLAWGLLGIALVAITAFALYAYIGVLVFAVFMYYAIRPIYQWLDDRLSRSNYAVTVTLAIVVVPLLLVLGYTAVIAYQELTSFFQSFDLDQYQTVLNQFLDVSDAKNRQLYRRLLNHPLEVIQVSITGVLRGNTEMIVNLFTTFLSLFFRLFLLLIFVFYLLRDDHKLSRWFHERVGGARVDRFMYDVDEDLRTIYVGNLATVIVIGLISVAVYNLFNLLPIIGSPIPYPTLLGILTGVGSLIPVLGVKIVYFPLTAVLFAEAFLVGSIAFWVPVVFFLIALVIVDTIPDFVIRSYISSRGIHFGLVLLSYTLGALVFGWYGLFLGPIVVVMLLHFGRTVFPQLVKNRGT